MAEVEGWSDASEGLQAAVAEQLQAEAAHATSHLRLSTQVRDLTRQQRQGQADLAAARAELRAAAAEDSARGFVEQFLPLLLNKDKGCRIGEEA